MTNEYAGYVAPGHARRALFKAFAAAMRSEDRRTATRVTRYIAESRFVARQIQRCYGLRSDVVYPPVDCARFRPADRSGHDDFFLFCGRLVEPYKRPSLAIEAFRDLPKRLVIVGEGPAYRALKAIAPTNVEFVGAVDTPTLRSLMQRCIGVIFPGVDDFGLVPLEAAACGRATIAFAGGGALETIVPGKSGELFWPQTAEALRRAVVRFDPDAYDPDVLRAQAERFGVARFQARMEEIVGDVIADQLRAGTAAAYES
jgi:glycosyltransferase involved in cell wall biosynthesis